ncbi:MAG: T9SS type A sorting domain-containing protein, partial [Ferruginibacter sp.]
FRKQHTTNALGNSSTVVNYSWADANPQPGNNFYRIKAFDKGGMFKYSAVIKVVAAKLFSGITIIANPVVGNNFSLSFNKMDKGVYRLRLINTMGQPVFVTELTHTGGSVIQKVKLGYCAAGNYQLEIVNPDNTRIVKAVIIYN